MRKLLRVLLTREVTLACFSDGDAFVVGRDPIPAKPSAIVRETVCVRVWRWKRGGSA